MIPNYRIWDKRTEQWMNVQEAVISNGAVYETWRDFEDGRSLTEDDFVFLLSTGCKDKNGKEIYDGSIVEIKNTERFIKEGNITCISRVKMHEGHVYVWTQPIIKGRKIRYGAHELYDGLSKYIDMKGVATSDVRVIGHICENPELLKES